MTFIKNIIKTVMGYKEIEFNVAGVTFKNGRKTRQAILRAIKYKDAPFDSEVKITFAKYEYENGPAIGVYANGQQIGNVPQKQLDEFFTKWTSDYLIESYKIVGGYNDTNYGCIIKVLFNK